MLHSKEPVWCSWCTQGALGCSELSTYRSIVLAVRWMPYPLRLWRALMYDIRLEYIPVYGPSQSSQVRTIVLVTSWSSPEGPVGVFARLTTYSQLVDRGPGRGRKSEFKQLVETAHCRDIFRTFSFACFVTD